MKHAPIVLPHIHEQNCRCSRCAPRRRNIPAAIVDWIAGPSDFSAMQRGALISITFCSVLALIRHWPAIVAALTF